MQELLDTALCTLAVYAIIQLVIRLLEDCGELSLLLETSAEPARRVDLRRRRTPR